MEKAWDPWSLRPSHSGQGAPHGGQRPSGRFEMLSGHCEFLSGRCDMLSGHCETLSGFQNPGLFTIYDLRSFATVDFSEA